MSFTLSWTCGLVSLYEDGPTIVLLAAGLTLGLTAALTIFAMTTKSDFTIKAGFCFVFFTSWILFGLFAIFMPYYMAVILYSTLGIIIYGFYIIFDTQLICGGKRFEFDPDCYILGALFLYIDIIGLFLELLRIFLAAKGR